MAQKKESDTLKQQRIARKEFLALKKMQSGEIAAGPKPSEIYEKPKTLSAKLKNLWYHDRPFILIGIVVVLLIAIFMVQCATKTKYDATVVLFTHQITGDPNCKKMGEYLSKYCEDIDGNGEVNVNVINCSIYENPNKMDNTDAVGDKSQHNYSKRTVVQSLLANDASALLFITDEGAYNYLQGLSDGKGVFEGEPIQFGEDFYEYCIDESGFFITPKGLQISCRRLEGTSISKDKDIDTYYKQAQTIIEGLKSKE